MEPPLTTKVTSLRLHEKIMKNYVVKSALNEQQLKGRVNDGFPKIEIQLFDDFLDMSLTQMMELVLEIKELEIMSIHAPIGSNEFVNIEDICKTDKVHVFNKLFLFCQTVAEYYNRDIYLVMHTNYSLETFKSNNQLKELEDSVSKIINIFPNVILCIENLVPIYLQKGGLKESDNYRFEVVEIVKHLRETLKTDRIFTVLDTAHAIISMNFSKQTARKPFYSLADYFEANKPYLKIIHIANSLNLGLCKGEHGVLLDSDKKEDLIRAKEIKNCLNTYAKDALFVIEVTEPNYAEIEHAKKTIKALEIE